ncbi:MAG: hypothetical protein IKN48_11745 [Bacteroidaceae bacterium]|nr:hypothetical protein [Bacteroidaceae bacterium]
MATKREEYGRQKPSVRPSKLQTAVVSVQTALTSVQSALLSAQTAVLIKLCIVWAELLSSYSAGFT